MGTHGDSGQPAQHGVSPQPRGETEARGLGGGGGGGTEFFWGGGSHVRGFSRRLPAEPTISPSVQKAWPRKSCRGHRVTHRGLSPSPTPPRGGGELLGGDTGRDSGDNAALTCLERSGLLESTSYLGRDGEGW